MVELDGIRAGREEDLPDLVEIYNHYVRHTHVTFEVHPVSVESRRAWLGGFDTTGRHRLLVSRRAGRTLGYATSQPIRPKPAYDPSVETTVYVHVDHCGEGIGSRLYSHLLKALEEEDVHGAYAGIALPNPGSIALHQKFGFRPVGTFPEIGRKFGRWWSVSWFQRPMPGGKLA